MVAQRKKKYESGEGAQYISRRRAIRKLQLSLRDFRTLCILKGIYPREPRNRKRAQKGETGIKTLYHTKDIHFLMHEPIIWQLRDTKVIAKRVARAKAINDKELCKKTLDKYPKLKLDHIVKERYPTFIDAIRDLDDCLTLCFLFSTFPSLKHLPKDQSSMCRRLTIEFLHSVIEAKALRKVFVSIKGYYFQADIKGELVTWIVPHHFSFEPQKTGEVDFKLMSTFVEFYTILLGFVNFRLYHSLNLYYPPKFPALDEQTDNEKNLVDEDVFVAERVAALNFPLSKTSNSTEEEVPDLDTFTNEDNAEKIEEIRKEAESIKTLKNLFKGLKFYLNREVPRESLVFIIRCFGGEVSWDKLLFVGATFGEDDETITHQIVDRPSMNKKYISRYYIQPQWIFDSVNARQLLPVNKYFMGAVLPPHLSPFVEKDRENSYIPLEEKALYDPELLEKLHNDEENSEQEDVNEENENSDKEEEMEEDGKSDESGEEMEEDEETPKAGTSKKMVVKPGKLEKEEPAEKTKQERQEYKLREKMIKGKHRRLYKNMMNRRRDHGKEAWLLEKKRKMIDEKKKIGKNGNNSEEMKETKNVEKKGNVKVEKQKKKVKASEKE